MLRQKWKTASTRFGVSFRERDRRLALHFCSNTMGNHFGRALLKKRWREQTSCFQNQQDLSFAETQSFLERYRYQLPCLHEGLEPDDANNYPSLAAWYDAMDKVPVYACRVKGDAGSWRKVLKMAGFGNAGFPPTIQGNIDSRIETVEFELARQSIDLDVWRDYASTRSYVADTPQKEAAAVMQSLLAVIDTDARERAES